MSEGEFETRRLSEERLTFADNTVECCENKFVRHCPPLETECMRKFMPRSREFLLTVTILSSAKTLYNNHKLTIRRTQTNALPREGADADEVNDQLVDQTLGSSMRQRV